MPQDELDLYLNVLAKTLRLNDGQRHAIAAELRDHLEQRLEELTERGLSREQAVQTALVEFGDAGVLAHKLTQTNPVRTRNRRHLMQTTFGTVLTCAAVTFAVMLLTPTNKDGQPTQPEAAAQDDAFGGPEADGGAPEEGGFGGGIGGDAFGGEAFNGGEAFGGEFGAVVQPARLELAIHVVDCTEILRPDRDRGDLLDRTAALANAVEKTVATVNPHGQRAIRVQPFEEFLIITATEQAYQEAQRLLHQISEHVARRAEIQKRRDAERDARLHRQREAQFKLEVQMNQIRQGIDQLERQRAELHRVREVTRTKHGREHPQMKALTAQIAAFENELKALRSKREEIALKLLQTQ